MSVNERNVKQSSITRHEYQGFFQMSKNSKKEVIKIKFPLANCARAQSEVEEFLKKSKIFSTQLFSEVTFPIAHAKNYV